VHHHQLVLAASDIEPPIALYIPSGDYPPWIVEPLALGSAKNIPRFTVCVTWVIYRFW